MIGVVFVWVISQACKLCKVDTAEKPHPLDRGKGSGPLYSVRRHFAYFKVTMLAPPPIIHITKLNLLLIALENVHENHALQLISKLQGCRR